MRRATAATHSGASRSISTPGSFSRRRARRGCAMRASPIQLGATTRMRGKRLVTFYGCALIDVLRPAVRAERSEEHTSELQSRLHLVCRLLLEKKKNETLLSVRTTALLKT